MLAAVYLLWYRHKRKHTEQSSSEAGLLRVSYHSLFKATNGFSSENLIGVGSFGSVYKGFLDHVQLTIAVKIVDLTGHGASRSFVAECETLRNVRHRNLVKVLSACSGFDQRGDDFKALVYEFLSNGSLDEWLHPLNGLRRKLNLIERLNIAIDIACALDYLHNNCVPPIVHCDLKPSNVLLNNDMVGHVSDFGLARFLPDALHKLLTNQTSSIGIKGSPGYIAPEYGAGGQVAAEGDVYSYGVLILEMLTGKRPTDDIFVDGFNLHCFAKEACSTERVVDIIIQEMGNPWDNHFARKLACLTSIVRIGVSCSSDSPRDRPHIADIVGSLVAIKDTLRKIYR
ncbi:hypothetical protein MLD38_026747 [Melastoma candidum]|uniref:Uncharacterized protein n=1 Tax=Melastoma candidum TaxID=119954 RepID=A0ACB9NZE2_9MYRT|nr:hypothetical protein MLD38_026747 [Melastoma candidum]